MKVISCGLMSVCLLMLTVNVMAQEAETAMGKYDYLLEVAGASLGVVGGVYLGYQLLGVPFGGLDSLDITAGDAYDIFFKANLGGSVLGATAGIGIAGVLLKKKGNLLFAAMGASVGIIPSLVLGLVSSLTFSFSPEITSEQTLWLTSGVTAVGMGSFAVLGYHLSDFKLEETK